MQMQPCFPFAFAFFAILGQLFWLPSFVAAESSYLGKGKGDGFRCAGIYGSPHQNANPKDNSRHSVLEIEIPSVPPSNITIAIFNYLDSRWLGIPVREGAKVPDEEVSIPDTLADADISETGAHRFTICNNETIAMDLCTDVDRGRPLINERDNKENLRSFRSMIYGDYLMLSRSGPGYTQLEYKNWISTHGGKDDHTNAWMHNPRTTISDEGATIQWKADGILTIRYLVNTTGFYCVDTASLNEFSARAQWINAHGQLPASEYPKLYIYLALMIAYICIAGAWAFVSWKVWSEILPVQNQLLGLVALLAVDMGLNFGYWKHYNAVGTPSTVYAVFTVFIDAGRNSLAFFMLLVVALGWGVVRPSLGKTMSRCILLAIVHFAAGCLYGAGLLFRDPHASGPLGLIYVMPLSVTISFFYSWTLSAIINTTRLLAERQQSYKLAMYNRLWRLLLVCMILLIVFFVLNILHTVFYDQPHFAAGVWKWRWFWTDGWLNIEFFGALCAVLYWWRPTMQNYRYSLEELAGDENQAAARDEALEDNDDSFDNPRMGENLEMEDFGSTTAKPASPSGPGPATFVIHEEELGYNSDASHHS